MDGLLRGCIRLLHRQQIAGGEDISFGLIQLYIRFPGGERDGAVPVAGGLDVLHHDAVLRSIGAWPWRHNTGIRARVMGSSRP